MKQKSSDYKETAVNYYLVEDKTQEGLFMKISFKMGVLNEKRCKILFFIYLLFYIYFLYIFYGFVTPSKV